jgi:hypothetical protein
MSNAIALNGALNKLLQPVVQFGFAGLCVVLLAMMGWQMHTNDQRFDALMKIQRETNQVIERETNEVIERNTAAIGELSRVVHNKL